MLTRSRAQKIANNDTPSTTQTIKQPTEKKNNNKCKMVNTNPTYDFDALGWIRILSDQEALILQNEFNSLCASGDIDAVKDMWKKDRADIPRLNVSKNTINNLVIDANTVLLTNNKKLAKWLENNRVDKKHI